MAPVTVSPTNDDEPDNDLALSWSGRVSLTRRILAVNVLALLMLAGGFFYLDSYRSRLVDNRTQQSAREAALIAEALRVAPAADRRTTLINLARATETRIRVFGADGRLIADTRAAGLRNFALRDPDRQRWRQDAARFLDAAIDTIVGAARDPLYRERGADGRAWTDVLSVLAGAPTAATVWRAPDRTPVITAAARISGGGAAMTTVNARNITRTVRDERLRLAVVLGVVTLVSILLSLFLARTIVRPIRRLARAAVRVRLGRAREVVVPRLPSRRDELGMLARALSDMSLALRARIDATEAFAADVTHELKNPLASLRSAVDGLAQVKDAGLRAKLLAVVQDDVRRLDRLISDISEASRLDAQLSRVPFEEIDFAALVGGLLSQRRARGIERGIKISFRRADRGSFPVAGDGARLERVVENLIDNAISFSPDRATIRVALERLSGELRLQVDDEGPGVPDDARDAVFQRFHSVRPEGEAFGQHSGLGLAIARTIVEAHQGVIAVELSDVGARFVVRLPLIERSA
ncbi:MAG: stimulus-sensing domain-containing protein [Pseudomonadota bacterium]